MWYEYREESFTDDYLKERVKKLMKSTRRKNSWTSYEMSRLICNNGTAFRPSIGDVNNSFRALKSDGIVYLNNEMKWELIKDK